MPNTERFREFVRGMTQLVYSTDDEPEILEKGKTLLHALVSHDDWLDERFAESEPGIYRQYLLHCDPLEKFSVVSFVWGAGVQTPIHNHTVWGLVGMLRGSETSTAYRFSEEAGRLVAGETEQLQPGDIEMVSPDIGDIHVVKNALDDQASISIHVYGANIGAVKRNTFDPVTCAPSLFISGYSNEVCPNIWDRSQEAAE